MVNDRILQDKVKRRKQLSKRQIKRQRLDPKFLKTLPEDIRKNPSLLKYWHNRFRLFSKFDQGIKLDEGKLNNIYYILSTAIGYLYITYC